MAGTYNYALIMGHFAARPKKRGTMTTVSPVVIAATARHTATIIFFHGLGDTGHGWASSMGAVRSPHIKVICPTAPTVPVTLNAGFRMPSWFDLRSLEPSGPEDEEEPLAGVIALSAWLPLHQKFPAEAIGNKNTPLLQCHGDCDPIVPYRWGQLTASVLKQFMTQTEFKTYRGMMHASCDEVGSIIIVVKF
ncbi:Acyl-protein thioesterase 1 [Melipona quadrifasciata]|uniref:palmitoyl-protein hydrolase n=1 Tax=Melipona quadrifasciata TaxID=166423 RepID=A0A0N0BIL3_9HYME|nr:Acyl-protein thioesterase 1 [Melipona quadrifasciata]